MASGPHLHGRLFLRALHRQQVDVVQQRRVGGDRRKGEAAARAVGPRRSHAHQGALPRPHGQQGDAQARAFSLVCGGCGVRLTPQSLLALLGARALCDDDLSRVLVLARVLHLLLRPRSPGLVVDWPSQATRHGGDNPSVPSSVRDGTEVQAAAHCAGGGVAPKHLQLELGGGSSEPGTMTCLITPAPHSTSGRPLTTGGPPSSG